MDVAVMRLNAQEILLIVLLTLNSVKAAEMNLDGTPTVELIKESEAKCEEIGANPYFETELVTGQPWRVYYMWNMMLENKCIDIQFDAATPAIINRIYSDMREYLEEQPAWGAASLLMTMGKSKRELLLFDDQGPAGRFRGVPNTLRDGSIDPTKSRIPLMKFQMKLVNNKKFLFLVDCIIGLACVSVRHDDPFTREELHNATKKMSSRFGIGYDACIADNKSI